MHDVSFSFGAVAFILSLRFFLCVLLFGSMCVNVSVNCRVFLLESSYV